MDTPRMISAGRGSSRLASTPLGPLVLTPRPAVDHAQKLAETACNIAIVIAIAVKLPKLWTSWVRGWFALTEA